MVGVEVEGSGGKIREGSPWECESVEIHIGGIVDGQGGLGLSRVVDGDLQRR